MIGVTISARAVQIAVDRGYAASSDAAMEMHTRLMHPTAKRKFGATTAVTIHADPDLWADLAAWCDERSVIRHGDGDARQREAAVLGRASAKIAGELERLAKHPAYRGVGVRGHDRRALPARRCGEGRWWPTTAQARAHSDGTTFAVEEATLYPRTVLNGGAVFTTWSPDRDRELLGAPEPGLHEPVERNV